MKPYARMEQFTINPIGTVNNTYMEPALTHQQGDLKLDEEILVETKTGKGQLSELVIDEAYAECLEGIEGFSHIMVLYWAHTLEAEKRQVKKVHPIGKKEFPKVGVFATRSPVRPNPICSTTVELVKRKGSRLIVKNLDALDGTPVLDIKFHHPSYDAPKEVIWPDWMHEVIRFFREKLK